MFLNSSELWCTQFSAFSLCEYLLYPACKCSGHTPRQWFCASSPQPSSSLKEKTLAKRGSIPFQLQYKSSGIFANLNQREKGATCCRCNETLAFCKPNFTEIMKITVSNLVFSFFLRRECCRK